MENKQELGVLEVLQLDLPYVMSPIDLYAKLAKSQPYTLLLESAEITSKKKLKSLMLIDAAVRIVCQGADVKLEALTENGEALLAYLSVFIEAQKKEKQQFAKIGLIQKKKNLVLHFPLEDKSVDEETRLHQASCFDGLRFIQKAFDTSNLPLNALFIGGLFAYDLVEQFEPLPFACDDKAIETAEGIKAAKGCPDYVFYVAETLLVIDHELESAKVQASVFAPKAATEIRDFLNLRLQKIKTHCAELVSGHFEPSFKPKADSHKKAAEIKVTESIDDLGFCATVKALKAFVIKGDVFQVVPSRTFMLPCPSPLAAYAQLKQSNPSPYMFYMQDKDFTLFGASPESALKYVKKTNQVEIYPIAGTRPRGKNKEGAIDLDLDGRIELALRNDEKEKAEHMMLVDLARNDVARISQAGTRYVADLLNVDRYSHVMHLVSRVVGQLREELDALHAYQACMNMGTLTGAPKIRAMQLIREVEKKRRGSYGGAVGYLTGEGDMDTCIVIRAAYVENELAYVQAGAGVVFDSVPQAEADETRAKAQAVISAIKKAHLGGVYEA